ncbi:hypothetical protein [Nostoc sp. WHI]|uniref:hypothetical protein n=1 Tax=Nostoc sp. WHI TaxID=2650611 RepID=UPI0018C625F3|nr:hypothetical protein [Nostoc sp. WHI]MBG1266902.1 hypothetical protein [Nostoc sp. WHI]
MLEVRKGSGAGIASDKSANSIKRSLSCVYFSKSMSAKVNAKESAEERRETPLHTYPGGKRSRSVS